MKIGLLYATRTGHSRKIAQAVARELGIEALDVKDDPRLEDMDMLYVVGGVYGGKGSPELIEFAKDLPDGRIKQAALLTSSGSGRAAQTDVRQILTDKGIAVEPDEFQCRGAILFVGMGHPGSADIKNAVAFVRRTLPQR